MIAAIDKGLISYSITDEDILSIRLIKAAQFMVLVGHTTGNGSWAEGAGDWAYDVNTHILKSLAKEAGYSSLYEFLRSSHGIELNYILMSFGMFSIYRITRDVFTIQKADRDSILHHFEGCDADLLIDFTKIREFASQSKIFINENLISFCEDMYKERQDMSSLRDIRFDRRCKYVLDNLINNNIVKNCAIDVFTRKTYDDIVIKDILLESLDKYSVSRYVSPENTTALRKFANNF